MFLKIIRNNFDKDKVLFFILFLFITIGSLLVSSSITMLTQLNNSISQLMESAATPHFLVLHKSELDAEPIKAWANSQSYMKKVQIAKMIQVENTAVYLGNTNLSESSSVMNFDFVKQNAVFDFLLDLKGQPVDLASGEIAVPLYFKEKNHLKVGDKVRIAHNNSTQEWTITTFVRDALMNPAFIHSKRFVLNDDDFTRLEERSPSFSTIQYLIEFQLQDSETVSEFANKYQLAGLPQNGPIIDHRLIRILNSVTDGIVVGILILISLLLILVALLCLRFTILTAIEEDYRQIGVLKALGVPPSFMMRLHLVKYALLAAAACGTGYLFSLGFRSLFIANIEHQLGIVTETLQDRLLPLLGTFAIFFTVVGFSGFVLRRLRKVSVMDVFRESGREKVCEAKGIFSMKASQIFGLNVLFALRDLVQRYRLFLFLSLVLLISVFIVIFPLYLLNTLQSPHFINYMGIPQSELRIDIHQKSEHISSLEKILATLSKDETVAEYAVFTTYRLAAINSEGGVEQINVEVGNYDDFPIHLFNGIIPENENQIALSYLESQQLGKTVGDMLELIVNGQRKKLIVSGIYQDITNGGLTAKARLPVPPETALWSVIQINFKPGMLSREKLTTYHSMFAPAKVTKMDDYLSQTLGHLLPQVKAVTIVSMLTGTSFLVLITSLFFRMLTTKDARQIAILKAIGFSTLQIHKQYMLRAMLVFSISIVLGILASNTLGEYMVGLVWSMMGAPAIQLIVHPLEVYVICPLVLTSTVLIATHLAVKIKEPNIVRFIVE